MYQELLPCLFIGTLKTLNFKDGPSPSFNNCHSAKDTSTLCNGLFADADFYDFFFIFIFFTDTSRMSSGEDGLHLG